MPTCSCENCKIEVYKNYKCILHCEKDDWYNITHGKKNWFKSATNQTKFWEEIEFLISNVNNNSKLPVDDNLLKVNKNTNSYNFINIIFPSEYISNVLFNLKPFSNIKEDKSIYFISCIFLDNIDLSDVSLANKVTFDKCLIEGDINFSNVVFKNIFLFQSTKVKGDFMLYNVNFYNIVSFIESTFFKNMQFLHTYFNGTILLSGTIIYELRFNSTFFKKEVSFLDIDVEKLDRETARIIKDSFEKQNNIIEANKFYALEMREREKELNVDIKKGKNFSEWLVFRVHGLCSDHSQDWLLALFWIINLTFLYSFLNSAISKDTESIKIIDLLLTSIIGLFSFSYLMFFFKKYIKKWSMLLFTILGYFFFSKIVVFDDRTNLFENLNLTNWNNLDLGKLLFKIIIAYLIYQLIISIRQNTRRK